MVMMLCAAHSKEKAPAAQFVIISQRPTQESTLNSLELAWVVGLQATAVRRPPLRFHRHEWIQPATKQSATCSQSATNSAPSRRSPLRRPQWLRHTGKGLCRLSRTPRWGWLSQAKINFVPFLFPSPTDRSTRPLSRPGYGPQPRPTRTRPLLPLEAKMARRKPTRRHSTRSLCKG